MNIKRKLLDILAPQEVKDMFSFLDGKKTLIGVVLAQLPMVIDAITQILSANGGDMSAWTKVSGAVLSVLGLLHKFIKDAPPKDAPPK